MTSISYAITVCDEEDYIFNLLKIINSYKRNCDEIVVLHDSGGSLGLYDRLSKGEGYTEIDVLKSEKFNGDFSRWKNRLGSLCSKDYIFNIDADETVTFELLHIILKAIKETKADLIYVPRVNTVKGITEDHLIRWGWVMDSEGCINWPDLQSRVYANKSHIYWVGQVHETIKGYKNYSMLPINKKYAIEHHKNINKQEQQNKRYNEY